MRKAFLLVAILHGGIALGAHTASADERKYFTEYLGPGCFKDGLPAKVDLAAILKKAEAGDAEAEYTLGCLYLGGTEGVSLDPREALWWLQKASDQKLAKAEDKLGFMYERGITGAPELEKASVWYLKAAEHGNANAQYKMASFYYSGMGVKRSEADAVKWYRKAAEQGHVFAQTDLGVFYSSGIGGPADPKEAFFWLSLASRTQGPDRDIASMLDGVKHSLTAEELSTLHKRVDDWKPVRAE